MTSLQYKTWVKHNMSDIIQVYDYCIPDELTNQIPFDLFIQLAFMCTEKLGDPIFGVKVRK